MKIIGDPNDLYKSILAIIREANEQLFIVSPYLRFKKDNSSLRAFREAFSDARNRGVKIYFMTRKDDESANLKNISRIRSFLNFQDYIYLVPKLHSKVYCNESQALLTSLNLSFSSLINQNKELGVLLDKNDQLDSNYYQEVISYLYNLKRNIFLGE